MLQSATVSPWQTVQAEQDQVPQSRPLQQPLPEQSQSQQLAPEEILGEGFEGFPTRWAVDHIFLHAERREDARESLQPEAVEGQPLATGDQPSGTAGVEQVQRPKRRRRLRKPPTGCAGPAIAAGSVPVQPLQQGQL